MHDGVSAVDAGMGVTMGGPGAVGGPTVPKPPLSKPSATPATRTASERSRESLKRIVGIASAVLGVDALVILTACALAWPLRELVPHVPAATPDGLNLAAQFTPVFLGIWLVCLGLNG